MKKLLIVLFVLIGANSMAQTYRFNPSLGTVSNKPFTLAQYGPSDGRSFLYDSLNFRWRPFVSTAEVLYYFNQSKYRGGNFSIWINQGGVLSNGQIAGGRNYEYYFKDNCVADSCLVLKHDTLGIPNTSIGEGYRIAVDGTNNIKTVYPDYGVLIDSTTNENGLTYRLDSATVFPDIRATISESVAGDTIYALFTGQSNSNGYNDVSDADTSSSSSVQAWNGSDWVTATIGQLPFGCLTPFTPSDKPYSVPAAFSFAKYLNQKYKKPIRIYLLAWGGNSINEWVGDNAINYHYLDSIISATIPSGNKLEIIGWQQGEADAGMSDTAYKRKWLSVYNQFRAEDYVSPNTDFVIGSEETINYGYWTPMEVKRRLALGDSTNIYFAESNGLTSIGDNVHYDSKSSLEMGRRMFQVWDGKKNTNLRVWNPADRNYYITYNQETSLGTALRDSLGNYYSIVRNANGSGFSVRPMGYKLNGGAYLGSDSLTLQLGGTFNYPIDFVTQFDRFTVTGNQLKGIGRISPFNFENVGLGGIVMVGKDQGGNTADAQLGVYDWNGDNSKYSILYRQSGYTRLYGTGRTTGDTKVFLEIDNEAPSNGIKFDQFGGIRTVGPSGYQAPKSLGDLGDNDFITKDIFVSGTDTLINQLIVEKTLQDTVGVFNKTNSASIIELGNDSLLNVSIVFTGLTADDSQTDLYKYYSENNGQTWSAGSVAVLHSGTNYPQTPSLYKKTNGDLLMVGLLSQGADSNWVVRWNSTDRGQTWSAATRILLNGKWFGPMGDRLFKRGSRLYYPYSVNTNSDVSTQTGVHVGKLMYSDNEGVTWDTVGWTISSPDNLCIEPGVYNAYDNNGNDQLIFYWRNRSGVVYARSLSPDGLSLGAQIYTNIKSPNATVTIKQVGEEKNWIALHSPFIDTIGVSVRRFLSISKSSNGRYFEYGGVVSKDTNAVYYEPSITFIDNKYMLSTYTTAKENVAGTSTAKYPMRYFFIPVGRVPVDGQNGGMPDAVVNVGANIEMNGGNVNYTSANTSIIKIFPNRTFRKYDNELIFGSDPTFFYGDFPQIALRADNSSNYNNIIFFDNSGNNFRENNIAFQRTDMGSFNIQNRNIGSIEWNQGTGRLMGRSNTLYYPSSTTSLIDLVYRAYPSNSTNIEDKWYITSEGIGYYQRKLGIATTSPLQALHVKGQIQVDTVVTGTNTDSVLVINEGLIKKVLQSSIGGSNLYNIDGTLTGNRTVSFGGFSLNFNGNTGFGASTVSARVHSLSTTEQLRLGYDASNYAPFTVSSSGNLTIAPTGLSTTITGGLQTGTASTNLYIPSTTGAPVQSQSELLIGGVNTHIRFGVRGSAAQALGTGTNYSSVVVGTVTANEFTSGNHPFLAQFTVKPLNVAGSGATVTDAYTAYIAGVSNATVSGVNGALKVDGLTNIVSTGEQLRASYDATNYTSITTNSGGNVGITPNAGGVAGLVQLFGGLQYSTSTTAVDANYTVLKGNTVIKLPAVTANRTITLPSVGAGTLIVLINQNIGVWNWTFASTVKDEFGVTITAVPTARTTILYHDGTGYVRVNTDVQTFTETSVSSLTLSTPGDYVNTDVNPGTAWTLPSLANSRGLKYFIKNAGANNLTINRAGSDQIFTTTTATSVVVTPGSSLILLGGQAYWYTE
jgi:hypothetical protein